MPSVLPLAMPLLWLVRALALLSSLAAGWLTVIKWINPRATPAGCGALEDCSALLDSRWSNWFSVPVTLLAATLWITVLLLTLPTANRWLGRTANQLLSACALLLLAGALWFGTLMVVVEKVWCPWCAALHLSALVVGTILLTASWKASHHGEAGLLCAAGQAGVAGAALLILGQLFGKPPDTHRITAETPPPAPFQTSPSPDAGKVSFLAGRLTFTKDAVPLMGSPAATHILAGFSDYTCHACRSQHGDLKALLKSAPETYAILILPTPLDPDCNPHLPNQLPPSSRHEGACGLARLALAFWKTAPDLFPVLHDYLMSAPLPLSLTEARAEADRLVPGIQLTPEAPWISEQISQNIQSWHLLSSDNSNLPKLVLRDEVVLHGSTANRTRFFEIMEETFPPIPAESIPVSTLPASNR